MIFKVAAVAAFAGGLLASAPAAEPVPAKSPLRVGYFGRLQTARGKDFVAFLEQHFAAVGQSELTEFRQSEAERFNVVILDYDEVKIVNNRIQMPEVQLDRRFARPTVTIGATGALVCDRLRLKTGYL
jgi:hypothetical protein